MGYHGDFKLLAAIGAWLGWQILPLTILLSSLVGAVVGIALIVFRRHGREIPIPFGPYLAAAGLLALYWGTPLTAAYVGLLYVGMAWNRRKHEPQGDSEILDTRELTLGVIGPLALAEEAQNLVHDVIGVDQFQGWDNQLGNEPALQMALDRKFKAYRGTGAITPGFSADTIRRLGLQLGNIETSAMVGIEGRVGWNIPNDFGTYPIRPGAENRPPSASSIHGGPGDSASLATRPRAGIHLFGTLETKLVLHDYSLDGNLFQSSHSVTRIPWVAQAAVGFSAQSPVAGHGVKLAVMRVWRSREFEEQGPSHAYGSVTLSIEF